MKNESRLLIRISIQFELDTIFVGRMWYVPQKKWNEIWQRRNFWIFASFKKNQFIYGALSLISGTENLIADVLAEIN